MLSKVYWSFGTHFESYEEFIQKVTTYNEGISKTHEWNPEQVITQSSKVVIYYEALWRNENDLLKVSIHTEDGNDITMGKLLYTLNNESVDFFSDIGLVFFEGLTLVDEKQDLSKFVLSIGT